MAPGTIPLHSGVLVAVAAARAVDRSGLAGVGDRRPEIGRRDRPEKSSVNDPVGVGDNQTRHGFDRVPFVQVFAGLE
jgi:hypothetical protein